MQNNDSIDTSAYWRKILKISDTPSKKSLNQYDFFLFKIFRPIFHFIIGAFVKSFSMIKVYGLENLPQAPFIIASNHLSSFDFPVIFLSLPEEIRKNIVAIYKIKYHKNLFTRFFIKLFISSIPVDMDNKPWEALASAVEILKLGGCVYIAPEGTRNSSGDTLEFKPGVGTLAVETQILVVPVYIEGTEKVLPKGKIIPQRHNVNIYFGKPIDFSSFQEKKKTLMAYEVYKEAAQTIREKILSLKK